MSSQAESRGFFFHDMQRGRKKKKSQKKRPRKEKKKLKKIACNASKNIYTCVVLCVFEDSKSVLFPQPTYKLDPSCGCWEHSHADYVLIFSYYFALQTAPAAAVSDAWCFHFASLEAFECALLKSHLPPPFFGFCCGLGEGEMLLCPPPWENACVLPHNSLGNRVLEKNKRKRKVGEEKDLNFETGCLGKLGCVCIWSHMCVHMGQL